MTAEQAERLIAAVERVAAALEAGEAAKLAANAKKGRRSKIDPEAFAADWAAGVKTADLAEKYGVTDWTVSGTARRLKLPPRTGSVVTLPPDREAEFREDWPRLSVADIQAKYGHTIVVLRRWAKGLGLPKNGGNAGAVHPGYKLVGREAEFAADYESGATLASLAAKYGYTNQSAVSLAARRLGLAMRQPRM